MKILQLIVTASIPVASLAMRSGQEQYQSLVTGTIAAILLVAEGIQQTRQLLPRWTKYRSAHDALRRERLLYEALAGSYAKASTPLALFTENVNAIISEENAAWLTIQQQIKQGK